MTATDDRQTAKPFDVEDAIRRFSEDGLLPTFIVQLREELSNTEASRRFLAALEDVAEGQTPCPSWCRDDHLGGFHDSVSWVFDASHSESNCEEGGLFLRQWVCAQAHGEEPAVIVLEVDRDAFGHTWLSAEGARVLASHLTAAADRLEQP